MRIILTTLVAIFCLKGFAQEQIHTISSGTSGDAIIRVESDTDNSNESDNSRIELLQDGGSLGAYIGFNKDWGGTAADNLFRIGTRYSNNDFYNRLTIRGSSGFVGMGTSDPLSSLHITSNDDGDAILTIESDISNSNESHNSEIHFIQDGGLVTGFIGFEGNAGVKSPGTIMNALLIGSEDGGIRPIQFISDDQVQMTINTNSVAIGTSSTGTHRLAVGGSIGAREIIVETGSWSDFVFNEDYPLMSLEELEAFILANKHLPDIPSELEVKEEGINLGEMDARLLQKMEELTLYIIEQHKEIQQLKETISKMNSQEVIDE